jgi:hypothetical protein
MSQYYQYAKKPPANIYVVLEAIPPRRSVPAANQTSTSSILVELYIIT